MKRYEFPSQAGFRLSRRRFMETAAVTAASVAVRSSVVFGMTNTAKPLIDTNVALAQWPFRHAISGDTPRFVAELRKQGVTQAWVSSLDALLHKDITSINERLAEECKQHGADFLIAIGAINPKLPNWEEDLRRCADVHRMPGIRLHPNYHGYQLSDPVFERLLRVADERRMLVQVSVLMEEERTIHPLVNVSPTDVAPLSTILKSFPNVRLQLLNASRTLNGTDMEPLAAQGVHFEIAMLEGLCGVEQLLKHIPHSRLCFGSYSPVFYFESARLKLQESDLAGVQMKAICSENALRLLDKA